MKAPKLVFDTTAEREFWENVLSSLLNCYSNTAISKETKIRINQAYNHEFDIYLIGKNAVADSYVEEYQRKYLYILNELEKTAVRDEEYEEAEIFKMLTKNIFNTK